MSDMFTAKAFITERAGIEWRNRAAGRGKSTRRILCGHLRNVSPTPVPVLALGELSYLGGNPQVSRGNP